MSSSKQIRNRVKIGTKSKTRKNIKKLETNNNGNGNGNENVKTCSYKNSKGVVNVSQFMRCGIKGEMTKRPKCIYEINDNSLFPFVVFDYGGGRAEIYNNRFNNGGKLDLNDKLMDVKYEQLFIGDNGFNDPYWRFKRGIERGNNILVQTGKCEYLFVGKGILSFSAMNGDIIRKFYSPMGGNYDSFPYAVGDKYVYFLNEKKYAPVGDFDTTKDFIRQYYCYEMEPCKKYNVFTLPMKILYKSFHGYY